MPLSDREKLICYYHTFLQVIYLKPDYYKTNPDAKRTLHDMMKQLRETRTKIGAEEWKQLQADLMVEMAAVDEIMNFVISINTEPPTFD